MFMSFVMKYLEFGCCPIFYHMSNMDSNSWRGQNSQWVLGSLINEKVSLTKKEKKDFFLWFFFCLHTIKIIGLKIFHILFASLQLNNENKMFILRQKNIGGT